MPDMGNGIGSSAFRKQEACDQKGSPSEEIFFSWHGLPLQEIAYIISGLHLDSRTFSQSRHFLLAIHLLIRTSANEKLQHLPCSSYPFVPLEGLGTVSCDLMSTFSLDIPSLHITNSF
ncbi:hypothetical protein PNOK_0692900 [Pyrrhoderma noxium]|uniref:Uncharacterized protein n=1 Tax=Pyrrhoderma noxium TaxID=2282107 RepID=A0A286UBE4_9AGAM|nr:hypothetical protein PNOK_0692900 [Pyrrhoderma noxium]